MMIETGSSGLHLNVKWYLEDSPHLQHQKLKHTHTHTLITEGAYCKNKWEQIALTGTFCHITQHVS
jgi:hypothetical protein